MYPPAAWTLAPESQTERNGRHVKRAAHASAANGDLPCVSIGDVEVLDRAVCPECSVRIAATEEEFSGVAAHLSAIGRPCGHVERVAWATIDHEPSQTDGSGRPGRPGRSSRSSRSSSAWPSALPPVPLRVRTDLGLCRRSQANQAKERGSRRPHRAHGVPARRVFGQADRPGWPGLLVRHGAPLA